MVRKSVRKVTSTYQRSLSGREVVGAVLGEKRSQKSVGNWLWAPNKRSRTSRRDVWVCDECENSSSIVESPSNGNWMYWVVLLGVALVAFMIFDDEGSSVNKSVAAPELNSNINNTDVVPAKQSFTIQIGSFAELENVYNAETTLRNLGLTFKTEKVTSNGREVWRVLVIGTGQQDPNKVLRLMGENGYPDAFVQAAKQ